MPSSPTQQWNAGDYAREGRFVADLAGDVVALLAPQPGERILDLGCGDGVLTQRLGAAGAELVAVDASPSMVEGAQALGLDARLLPAEQLNFSSEFDAVFSNAALHWVRGQDAMLAGVHRALRPGGRFVAEMGGHGNIAALRVALRAALNHAGYDTLAAGEAAENYFPSATAYQARLESHGFRVESIGLYPRPTPLAAGGVRGWYRTFRTGVLQALSEEMQEQVLTEAETLLLPVLAETRTAAEALCWTADYVRLRFHAVAIECAEPGKRFKQQESF